MNRQLIFKSLRVSLAIGGCCLAIGGWAAADSELAAMVARDLREPVRPGGVDGQAFWNMNALSFMYPPSFDFPKVEGAERYRFRVIGSDGKMREFFAEEPTASLAPIWAELPTGRTELWMEACFWKNHCLKRFYRSFWKNVPYRPGAYPAAPRSYAEAARLGYEYLLTRPHILNFVATGKPDHTYLHNCYPAKMHAATVEAMVRCAKRYPEMKDRALKLARTAADYLISVSEPADAPLAHFPPTYEGKGRVAATRFKGQIMLIYPACAGSAYLDLHRLTGDARYLEAARGIAATYLRLQGADGSWHLKLQAKDGQPVGDNRLHPCEVIDFMDAMFAATSDTRYRDCADRAFGYFDRGPLADWDWEGQFEDIYPNPFKYVNQTKHPACSVAIRICRRWPNDAKRIAQAREILRFAEDQFVYWEQPFAAERINIREFSRWADWMVAPAVVEQYHYRMPVDASAAKLIQTYLALYGVTGNPLDLAKARTLGDSIVRVQRADGRIPTLWAKGEGDDLQNDWINCLVYALEVLEQLAAGCQ